MNFLIILLVVVILVTILLIVIKYGRNQINEKRLSDVVEEFNSKYDNENDSDTQISEDIKIDDYTVVGIITIPKMIWNIQYWIGQIIKEWNYLLLNSGEMN